MKSVSVMALVLAALATATFAAAPTERYWQVRRLPDGDRAVLRAGPSPRETALVELTTGVRLRDLGCVDAAGGRWCRVETRADGQRRRGWVDQRLLRPPGRRDDPLPPTAGAAAPLETLRYDEIGQVPCSAPGDEVDASCAFRLVRDFAGATLLLANPARAHKAPLRVIRWEGDRFSTRDGSLIWSEPADGGWLVIVDGDEFYRLRRRLLAGTDSTSITAGARCARNDGDSR